MLKSGKKSRKTERATKSESCTLGSNGGGGRLRLMGAVESSTRYKRVFIDVNLLLQIQSDPNLLVQLQLRVVLISTKHRFLL